MTTTERFVTAQTLLISIALFVLVWLAYERTEIKLVSPFLQLKRNATNPDSLSSLASLVGATTADTITPVATPTQYPSIIQAPVAPTAAPTKATLRPTSAPTKAAAVAAESLTSAPSESPRPDFQTLSNLDVWKYFNQQPLTTFQQIANIFPKPSTTDNDMVAVYSQTARRKLLSMLTTTTTTHNNVLMVNGGSSMTGAGAARVEERCQAKFAEAFTTSTNNITVIDRAHGTRNSFHSMLVMQSYFPAHVDVVLWEFAINDVAYNMFDKERGRLEQRNQFLLFLEQLARVAKQRQQEPPLILLLYLWDTPYTMMSTQRVFDSHRHMAEAYDFVVGHVNAANYYRSWNISEEKVKTIAFADIHHPSKQGHLILAYLLHDLVTNEDRKEKPKDPVNTLAPPSFTWVCENKTQAQRQVQEMLEHHYPVASFTEEVPMNDQLLPGMLQPNDLGNLAVQNRGKTNELRHDRQQCIELPCCEGSSSHAALRFDVSHYSNNNTPLFGMHVNFSPLDRGVQVWLDDDNVTPQLVSAKHWGCLLGIDAGSSTFLADWVVLPQPRYNVTTISFCSNIPACGSDPRPEMRVGIMSLTLYGGG